MAEPRTYPHGVTCWIDTEQPDPQAADRFYSGLFGWTLTDAVPADAPGSYLIATLDGQDVAAIGPASGDAATWNTYIAVDDADTSTAVTQAYLAALNAVIAQINILEAQIAAALAAHPDSAIFTSLPRAGTVRAAWLLAEIGDCRGRFPTPAALAGLAGVTPSTRQSGNTRIITFRWAVDKHLRNAVCNFAADSRLANPWAADLYQQARTRGKKHNHAVRILARAWITVIWKCWTTNTPYNPDHHRALQTLLNQPPPTG